MEIPGFARLNVAGEYYPSVAWAFPTADISTTAVNSAPAEMVSVYLYTEAPDDQLIIQVSGLVHSTVGGGSTPLFEIRVDGVVVGDVWHTYPAAGGIGNLFRNKVVTNLQVGLHKVSLFWAGGASAGTAQLQAASTPQNYHGSLIAWRTRKNRSPDMGGYPALGMSSLNTTGTSFTSVTAATTNIGTTPTTTLLTLPVQTFYFNSALLIRFSAAGKVNTSANAAKFRILVDGTAIGGTSQGSGGAFRFNAFMTTVTGVQAGNHTVEVQWCGGPTAGSTIDPVTAAEHSHAELLVEEVFCPDVSNIIFDKEGFPTQFFSSGYLPQVRYIKLTQDIVGTGGGPPNQVVADLDMYVTGDNSSVQIEATCGSDVVNSTDTQNFRLWIDKYSGVVGINTVTGITCGSAQNPVANGMNSAISRVVRLNQGWHKILICWASTQSVSKLAVASSPDGSHAGLLVREINAVPQRNSATFAVGSFC